MQGSGSSPRSWTTSPRLRFILWALLVLLCGAWHSACTPEMKARSVDVDTASGICFSRRTIQRISPRWLSSFVGQGGPFITWILVIPSMRTGARTALFLDVLLWYIVFIMPVRYTHLLLPASLPRWDPSGHVFVYGAQLVTLWLGLHVASLQERKGCTTMGASLRSARVYAVLLWYLTSTTSAFFHTLSESLAAVAIVALPLFAHERILGAFTVWASLRTGLAGVVWWCLSLAAALRALHGNPAGSRTLWRQVVYDMLVWVFFWVLYALERRYWSASAYVPMLPERPHGSGDTSDRETLDRLAPIGLDSTTAPGLSTAGGMTVNGASMSTRAGGSKRTSSRFQSPPRAAITDGSSPQGVRDRVDESRDARR
mmetsp:Transcript_19058/g.51196  ORF Transcript_19058/g.51196 Transcript_19058/m.51196 type:complete len:371 (+) Transcript_19058:60-1172(+)